ncbi:hypothetical protein HYV82_03495 [Candidatus Woesearchaeota archaeon]|nr:hypothetical protein [Candidatus Woesearchaeota archaeon]
MRRISTVKDLTLAGGFGALLFAIDAVFTPLDMILGIPGVRAVVNTFFWIVVACVAVLITRKTGFLTATLFVYALLSVPLITWGAPGFHKLLIIMPLAILVEAILLATNYSNTGIAVAIASGVAGGWLLQLYVMSLLGIPGVETYMKVIVPFTIIGVIEGLIGGFAGIWLYNRKIKNLKVVKQLQSQ